MELFSYPQRYIYKIDNTEYNNIYIGFIDKNNIPEGRRKNDDDYFNLNRIYNFIHECCIIQYSEKYSEDSNHNCVICNTAFKNKIYIYYDKLDRYIFPEYYWHMLKQHNMPFDDRILKLI